MSPRVRLCRLDALADPGSRGFEVETEDGPESCMLVRRDGAVFAYRNRCPHVGAPLDWAPGQFLDTEGRLIQCAFHGALFLMESGECIRGPCVGRFLAPVPVGLADGWVLVPGERPAWDA
jgi:nitrite reductase/ring-hydroxylating ferredoxin subunit